MLEIERDTNTVDANSGEIVLMNELCCIIETPEQLIRERTRKECAS